MTKDLKVTSETRSIAGVAVYVADPQDVPKKNKDKALIFLHGGGLVIMGGECTHYFGLAEAIKTRCRTYIVDYRNPPDHPYPCALNDCVAVYRELLKTHPANKLIISGTSGGGNLTAAMTLKIRDLGLDLPAAVGLFTPEVDLTESGDTFETNKGVDTKLPKGLPELNALYANGHDLRHPYVSPVFADFSKGFHPTFVQTGTRDLFLSNSVLIHRALRRADIPAELHVGEAMPHGGFGGAPGRPRPSRRMDQVPGKDRRLGATLAGTALICAGLPLFRPGRAGIRRPSNRPRRRKTRRHQTG